MLKKLNKMHCTRELVEGCNVPLNLIECNRGFRCSIYYYLRAKKYFVFLFILLTQNQQLLQIRSPKIKITFVMFSYAGPNLYTQKTN